MIGDFPYLLNFNRFSNQLSIRLQPVISQTSTSFPNRLSLELQPVHRQLVVGSPHSLLQPKTINSVRGCLLELYVMSKKIPELAAIK